MGISRLGFLVSWAAVLTASKPKKAIYLFSLMWVTNSKKSLIKEKRY